MPRRTQRHPDNNTRLKTPQQIKSFDLSVENILVFDYISTIYWNRIPHCGIAGKHLSVKSN